MQPITKEKIFLVALGDSPEIGYIIECGVGDGRSMRWLANFANKPIHGFDSFKGLPEDWVLSEDLTYPAGSFACDEPKEFDNVTYHVGMFEDTLPIWSEQYPGMIAFLHIDSDLYSSCVTILDALNHQIVPTTIIVFDDIFETPDYKYWERGEYKAFNEWLNMHDRTAHQLAKGPRGQAVFRILK